MSISFNYVNMFLNTKFISCFRTKSVLIEIISDIREGYDNESGDDFLDADLKSLAIMKCMLEMNQQVSQNFKNACAYKYCY